MGYGKRNLNQVFENSLWFLLSFPQKGSRPLRRQFSSGWDQCFSRQSHTEQLLYFDETSLPGKGFFLQRTALDVATPNHGGGKKAVHDGSGDAHLGRSLWRCKRHERDRRLVSNHINVATCHTRVVESPQKDGSVHRGLLSFVFLRL